MAIRKRILFLGVLIFLLLTFSEIASAKEIILNDLNGKAVKVSAYQGKPVILFFWTSWCHYCRGQIKILNQNLEQLKKDGITVLAVNIGESSYRAQGFFNFKDADFNFKVLLDEKGDFANNYDVLGVPTYILLDKTGKVVSVENTFPVDYKILLADQLKK